MLEHNLSRTTYVACMHASRLLPALICGIQTLLRASLTVYVYFRYRLTDIGSLVQSVPNRPHVLMNDIINEHKCEHNKQLLEHN